MSTIQLHLQAAHNLVGFDLDGGWNVLKKIPKDIGSTGGHFSVCYQVKNVEGKLGFLKVLDLTKALAMPGDSLTNIRILIQQFEFERETVLACRDYKLGRIAAAIVAGKLDITCAKSIWASACIPMIQTMLRLRPVRRHPRPTRPTLGRFIRVTNS